MLMLMLTFTAGISPVMVIESWHFFVIYLMFCHGIDSVKLSDLSRVCVYYFPFDTNQTAITPPKNVCTAVATYGENSSHPTCKYCSHLQHNCILKKLNKKKYWQDLKKNIFLNKTF